MQLLVFAAAMAAASAAITWHECGRTLRHLTRQRNPEGGDQ